MTNEEAQQIKDENSLLKKQLEELLRGKQENTRSNTVNGDRDRDREDQTLKSSKNNKNNTNTNYDLNSKSKSKNKDIEEEVKQFS